MNQVPLPYTSESVAPQLQDMGQGDGHIPKRKTTSKTSMTEDFRNMRPLVQIISLDLPNWLGPLALVSSSKPLLSQQDYKRNTLGVLSYKSIAQPCYRCFCSLFSVGAQVSLMGWGHGKEIPGQSGYRLSVSRWHFTISNM